MDRFSRALTEEEEARFQSDMSSRAPYATWAQQFRQRYGDGPNLNDPQYDYRKAWRLGAAPQAYEHDSVMHWPSQVEVAPYRQPVPLKSADHPTAWMEPFMQRFGVDPNDAIAAGQTTPEMREFMLKNAMRGGMFGR